VGQCPGIVGPCCHGDDEVEVYRSLCQIVEDWIAIARQDGRPLPPPTARKDAARVIAEMSFRRGWTEAQRGETLPVEQLWEGIDAE
jgi:hypothetical protein